jgi:hypothetical protein
MNRAQFDTLATERTALARARGEEMSGDMIDKQDNWDGKRGTRAPRRRVGPNIVGKAGGVSGADERLAEQFSKADGALPEGVNFDRRASIERTTEAQNAKLRG